MALNGSFPNLNMEKNKIIDQKTANYWNKRGKTYSRSWQSLAKKKLSKMETDLVEEVVQLRQEKTKRNKLKTLDIGIGTGRITQEIIKYKVEHYGTDVSETMIEYCKEKFRENSKIKELIVHDILTPLPSRWKKFDVITAIRVLSYSSKWPEVVCNLYKSMKPGGFLIFTFPNKYSSMFISKTILWRKKQTPYCDVSKKELEKVIKKIGFSEYKITGFFRLLDIFYDWSDSKNSTRVLFSIENMLDLLLGKTFLTRLFYIICKK